MEEDFKDFTVLKIKTKEDFEKYFSNFRKIVGWSVSEHAWTFEKSYDGSSSARVFFFKGEPFMIRGFFKIKSEKKCYFNNYITLPEFRGKGLSMKMFLREFNKVREKGYKFFCTGTDTMTPYYMSKLGLSNYGIIGVLKVQKSLFPQEKVDPKINMSNIDLEKVIQYDSTISRQNRSNILTAYFKTCKFNFATFEEDGKINGYGVEFQFGNDRYITPISAESAEIAICILNALTHNLSDEMMIHVIPPIIQESNPSYINWKKYGFKKDYYCALLGHEPFPNDFSKTFSVFNLSHTI